MSDKRSAIPLAAQPGPLDVVSTWVLPRLLLSPRLAGKIDHVLLGVIALYGIALAERLPGWLGLLGESNKGVLERWWGLVVSAASSFCAHAVTFNGEGMVTSAGLATGGAVMSVLRESAWAGLITFGLSLCVLSVCYFAIARGASVAMAAGQRAGSFVSLLRRGVSLSVLGVVLTPLILVPLVALLCEGLGYVLLRVEYLNIIGSILLGINIVLSMMVVVLLVAGLFGLPLFLPALAAESSDGIDAVQRVYAYAIRGWARLFIYYVVVAAVGVVVIAVVFGLAAMVSGATSILSTAWLPAEQRSELLDPIATLAWNKQTVAEVTGAWIKLPLMVAGGYAISYVACAATLCYLGIRRYIDGQDMQEVWDASSLEGERAKVNAVLRREEERTEIQDSDDD